MATIVETENTLQDSDILLLDTDESKLSTVIITFNLSLQLLKYTVMSAVSCFTLFRYSSGWVDAVPQENF